MKPVKIFIACLLLLISIQSYTVLAQGCSDAGFCTMGAMRPNQNYLKKTGVQLRSVELLHYVGYTKFDDIIQTTLVDINANVGQRSIVQLKVPYQTVDGPLGKTKGMGDISYSFSYQAYKASKFQIGATLGGKIPTNNANLKSDRGLALPMYYQTSLGTYDIVAGLSLVSRKWLFAAGYQHAFNRNGNEFVWAPWNKTADSARAAVYPRANKLKRGDDIMLRAERNFRSTKWNAHLGILGIYRLNQDNIVLKNQEQNFESTIGWAITAVAGVGYHVNTHATIKLLYGKKIINRDFNPDGLSREFVTTLSLEWRL